MGRILRALLAGLLLTCPACRHGDMFRGAFRMNVRCPACGVIFERDSGEITGGIAINSLVTSTLAVVLAAYLAFSGMPVLLELGGLTLFVIAFALLFYRHARGLWTSILYLTGDMFED
jgi:uncharacterized protein (DUF983 family)